MTPSPHDIIARSPLPTRQLERIALGELDGEERAALLARHGMSEAELAPLLEALRASNQEILTQYPASQMVPRLSRALQAREAGGMRQRPPRQRPALHRASRLAPPILLAAAALWMVAIFLPEQELTHTPALTPGATREVDTPTLHQIDDRVRIKGDEGERLQIWRQGENGEPERLDEGAEARAGETLQLKYRAGKEERYGVIASLDGRGVVTLHHPARAEQEATLEPGLHAIPYGYTLDDAPRFETFFLVSCTRPIEARRVLEAIERRAGDALPVEEGCRTTSVRISKEGER